MLLLLALANIRAHQFSGFGRKTKQRLAREGVNSIVRDDTECVAKAGKDTLKMPMIL